MKLSICLSIFAIAEAAAPDTYHWTVGQPVNTQSGIVHGRAASKAPGVSTYLGIPYAKPPIGDLRFESPQKYEGKEVIDGTNFGPSCPISIIWGSGAPANFTGKNFTAAGHEVLDFLLQTGDTFSEDCLTLNIWTKPQVGERKKAVMIWIYGGGFTVGRSSDPTYDGQFFVDQEDVIVVSINYRENIFGFPGNPDGPLNPGFLDQRLAIEWIRDNIAAFGGDSSRITLFGQSAGSASIDFYSYAYTSDPIISGIILESGTATGLGYWPLEYTSESWYNVTSALSCGDANSDQIALLRCMRSKSTQEISNAIPLFNQAFGAASFWPTIDNISVFSDYAARSAAGNFIKVPMLIGNADFEAGYFRAMSSLYDLYQPDPVWVGFSNASFSCPAAKRAQVNTAKGIPTWRYRYYGTFEDLKLTTNPDSGAYHGSEIAVIWGTLMDIRKPTEEETRVGRELRGAWAAFAKDPVKGLKKYRDKWPVYEEGKQTLIRLAYENKAGIGAVDPALYDSTCV